MPPKLSPNSFASLTRVCSQPSALLSEPLWFCPPEPHTPECSTCLLRTSRHPQHVNSPTGCCLCLECSSQSFSSGECLLNLQSQHQHNILLLLLPESRDLPYSSFLSINSKDNHIRYRHSNWSTSLKLLKTWQGREDRGNTLVKLVSVLYHSDQFCFWFTISHITVQE